MAFCHKVSVRIANASTVGSDTQEDTTAPPDMSQPVLLEVQRIKVHEVEAKVMFDKGSTAVLVTHGYAEKQGFKVKRLLIGLW